MGEIALGSHWDRNLAISAPSEIALGSHWDRNLAISPPSEIATPVGCISAPLGSMTAVCTIAHHTTCTPRVHSLLPVHSALPYLGRSNCGICVMRESLSEELRAEVRTRNLRRVVLLGVTFGTRGYGVRVAFCSGSMLLVVHRLLHAKK